MMRKFLISGLILGNSLMLVLMLLLGSQNLKEKHSLNLGLSTTEALPTGFLIGMSIALGSLSGGLTLLTCIPSDKNNF